MEQFLSTLQVINFVAYDSQHTESLNFSKPRTYNLFKDDIPLKSGKGEPLPLRSLILLFTQKQSHLLRTCTGCANLYIVRKYNYVIMCEVIRVFSIVLAYRS